MNYTHRYIAKFTVEAETALSIGSGEKGLITDKLVAKDANGLPYIPGTGLTGVLRHSFPDKNLVDEIFGSGGENGKGSRLILSAGCLIGEDGKTVIEGLRNIDINSGYYSYFSRLPERDHVRINDKGAAVEHGKYDEELVHKGTRFVFDIELIGDETDKNNWTKLLEIFASPIFRIGSGTRKGFGKLKIIKEFSKTMTFDLSKEAELKSYLNKSSSLNESVEGWEPLPKFEVESGTPGWTKHVLNIQPKDFFLFDAGFGDDDADNKPKTETYFDWENGVPKLTEKAHLLIPGTSIKGAIAHRVSFHYNQMKNVEIGKESKINIESSIDVEKAIQKTIDQYDIETMAYPSESDEWEKMENEIDALTIEKISDWKDYIENIEEEVLTKKNSTLPVGENNEAVKELFGYAKNSDNEIDGLRGRVIINDLYLPYNRKNDKVFNHTKIDRFTNGTIDGALFQEKATQYKDSIQLEIWVEDVAFLNDAFIGEAFNQALIDITEGSLQLGGNTTKGHGVFTGAIN